MAAAKLSFDQTDLSSIVGRVASTGERVVLTRDGEPVVTIVPAADAAWLEALEDRLDAAELRRAREAWERGGQQATSLDEVVLRLGLTE